MAASSIGDGYNPRLTPVINDLLFETPGGTRYTQDSPILPNIWFAYARDPRRQVDLILNVEYSQSAATATKELGDRLIAFRSKAVGLGDSKERRPSTDLHKGRFPARLSVMPGQIAVKLYFDELISVVLPMTTWWHDLLKRLQTEIVDKPASKGALSSSWGDFPLETEGTSRDLIDALLLMRRELLPRELLDSGDLGDATKEAYARKKALDKIPDDLAWFVRIAGWIGWLMREGRNALDSDDLIGKALYEDVRIRSTDEIEKRDAWLYQRASANFNAIGESRANMVDGFFWLIGGERDLEPRAQPRIHRINKNRRVHLAVNESSLTVKADAERRLFNVNCSGITWAIIDSGIDGGHPAFRNTTVTHEMAKRRALFPGEQAERAAEAGKRKDRRSSSDRAKRHPDGLADKLLNSALDSRITKTLDFTHLREILEFDLGAFGEPPNEGTKRKLADRVARNLATRTGKVGATEGELNDAAQKIMATVPGVLNRFRKDIADGRPIAWQQLEDIIVDPNPELPENDHGTHVAGILGADWIEDVDTEIELPLAQRTRKLVGVCPDINLIDVRVFRQDGLTDEFELMAAIQYLRWMNSRAGYMQVHGANMSLSLVHEVRRFACGQTPICVECNEASAAGMVIVAAAGNRGFDYEDLEEIRPNDGYRTVSLTDPGNADSVITVGATHRRRPHEYGVSYFSSRGPTGDGRMKPDVVAPGEKIIAPVPGELSAVKDGTSMAAPHVSGAAAMLMARHSELIAHPARIKKIICSTATDLGRERYFQGAGLVDTLRALQSI